MTRHGSATSIQKHVFPLHLGAATAPHIHLLPWQVAAPEGS
jgi:hypothetical protein